MGSKEVNVLGWYNHGNIGDESYKLSFSKVLPNLNLKFIDKLKSPIDTCFLGGGDVLGGYFLDQISFAQKKIALSVGVNDSISKEHINSFDLICTRDTKSFNIAKDKGANALLYPDFAYSLVPDKSNGLSLLKKLFSNGSLDLYERKIAVIVNSYLMPGFNTPAYKSSLFEKLCYDLALLADSTNASFVFIPFGNKIPTDDTISNGIVASKCKFWKKNLLIKNLLSVQETLDVLSVCDLSISTRLHSSIFSCISGVPFIDITHNHKNAALISDMDYPYAVPYEYFSKKDLENLINIINNKSQEIKDNLLRITLENQNKLKELQSNVHLL